MRAGKSELSRSASSGWTCDRGRCGSMSRRISWTSERKRSGSAPRTKRVTPRLVLLRERLIEVGSRLLAERTILAVPDDSHRSRATRPLPPRARRVCTRFPRASPVGSSARRTSRCDHHRLRSLDVRRREVPSSQQSDPHRPKVVEPDDVRRHLKLFAAGI